MAIKFSELIALAVPRDFEYAGKTVKLEIFTQKVTPAYRAAWLMLDKTRDTRCQLIADMVASWDVLGDDDKPQAISYEFLQLCPDEFLNQATEVIEALLFPNPQPASSSEKTSPSGSQPTEIPPAS